MEWSKRLTRKDSSGVRSLGGKDAALRVASGKGVSLSTYERFWGSLSSKAAAELVAEMVLRLLDLDRAARRARSGAGGSEAGGAAPVPAPALVVTQSASGALALSVASAGALGAPGAPAAWDGGAGGGREHVMLAFAQALDFCQLFVDVDVGAPAFVAARAQWDAAQAEASKSGAGTNAGAGVGGVQHPAMERAGTAMRNLVSKYQKGSGAGLVNFTIVDCSYVPAGDGGPDVHLLGPVGFGGDFFLSLPYLRVFAQTPQAPGGRGGEPGLELYKAFEKNFLGMLNAAERQPLSFAASVVNLLQMLRELLVVSPPTTDLTMGPLAHVRARVAEGLVFWPRPIALFAVGAVDAIDREGASPGLHARLRVLAERPGLLPSGLVLGPRGVERSSTGAGSGGKGGASPPCVLAVYDGSSRESKKTGELLASMQQLLLEQRRALGGEPEVSKRDIVENALLLGVCFDAALFVPGAESARLELMEALHAALISASDAQVDSWLRAVLDGDAAVLPPSLRPEQLVQEVERRQRQLELEEAGLLNVPDEEEELEADPHQEAAAEADGGGSSRPRARRPRAEAEMQRARNELYQTRVAVLREAAPKVAKRAAAAPPAADSNAFAPQPLLVGGLFPAPPGGGPSSGAVARSIAHWLPIPRSNLVFATLLDSPLASDALEEGGRVGGRKQTSALAAMRQQVQQQARRARAESGDSGGGDAAHGGMEEVAIPDYGVPCADVASLVVIGGNAALHRTLCSYLKYLRSAAAMLSATGLDNKPQPKDFYLVPVGRNDIAAHLALHDPWYRKHVWAPFAAELRLTPPVDGAEQEGPEGDKKPGFGGQPSPLELSFGLVSDYVQGATERVQLAFFECLCWRDEDSADPAPPSIVVPMVCQLELGLGACVNRFAEEKADSQEEGAEQQAAQSGFFSSLTGHGGKPAPLATEWHERLADKAFLKSAAASELVTPEVKVSIAGVDLAGRPESKTREQPPAEYLTFSLSKTRATARARPDQPRIAALPTEPASRLVSPSEPWFEANWVALKPQHPQSAQLHELVKKKDKKPHEVKEVADRIVAQQVQVDAVACDIVATNRGKPFVVSIDLCSYGPFFRVKVVLSQHSLPIRTFTRGPATRD
jgi:hypothetical protein